GVSSAELQVTLSGADPAIIPFNAKLHGNNFATHLPVMQVQLKHNANPFAYEVLQEVRLQSVDLAVDVTGIKTLAISNDFGPVDASQPFMPFGALANGGESLVIGSKEIFQKNLTKLTFSPEWQAAPSAYPSNIAPTMKLEYLAAGVWNPTEINIGFTLGATHHLILAAATLLDKPDFSALEQYNLQAKHGFFRLKLDKSFGYAAYQLALVNYAQAVAKGINQSPPSTIVTPMLSGLSMAYNATQSIDLSVAEGFDNRTAYFYHLTPFGYAEQHAYLKADAPDPEVYLFSQFKHEQLLDVSSIVKSEAEFYIGISKLKPPQNISLLFQVLDGSADPLTIKPALHLHWSYLANNEWYAFAKQDVDDRTDGFLNSGIVKLAVPREVTDDNTLLATGMHWIRVCVSEKSAATCKLLLVAAQALKVTFADHQNDVNYQSNALTANTIAQLNNANSKVKSVSQPFESFGGRRNEDASQFYVRVSERLRHKDRAIALWDYEHLILEAFPQIYQVKCLNHTHYQATENGEGIYRELAAGHVTLVTIPSIQSLNINNPLRPYTSLGLLEQIKQYLTERQSDFVELHLANPEFEEVQLRFKLRLLEGFDEAFYVQKLQQTLTQYLSPWINVEQVLAKQSLTFGGRLYKSVLINFIEEQSYVDYITDVQLIHYYLNTDGL
ncbi:MAG: baseplate J/gp47 family protein, partial [Methylophilus sp.]